MFILRSSSYRGPGRDALGNLAQTGKPDGMMIRASDDCYTDNKAAAKLFDTAKAAADYYTTVLKPAWTHLPVNHMMFVVEVETKPVVHQISKTAVMAL